MEPSKRALCAKEKGRRGGLSTARNATSEFLEQRAMKAGIATRDKYGIGFYNYIKTIKKPRSSKDKIIHSIIPDQPIPTDSLELIQAAAKTIG